MSNLVSNYVTAASVGPRFLGAGIMLAIMAAWIRASHDHPDPLLAIVLVGVAAAISVVWGLRRLRVADDSLATTRLSGMLALGGAVLTAGVSAWLAWQYRLEALGETLGLALFAILAAATALRYMQAGSERSGSGWDRVRAGQAGLGLLMALVGAAGLVAFFYITMVAKAGNDWIPELIALLLTGFLLFFGGMYLFTTKSPPPTDETLRVFFLVLGIVLGAICANMAVIRGFLESDQIVRSSTQAGESWRLWAVAYPLLAGIALIVASLSLAFGQVRESAGLRRSYYGVKTAVTVVLVLFALGTIYSLVCVQLRYTFNWTKTRGVTVVSGSTKNLLAKLDQNVHVYAILNPGTPIYDDMKHFLANCQAYSNKFDYEFIDPEKSSDYEKFKTLATRFQELIQAGPDRGIGRGVLIVYGPMPEDVKAPVPHAFLTSQQLYEEKGGGGPDPSKSTLVLKAESEIMKELSFLANKSDKRKIYFLQGDDELSITRTDRVQMRINATMSLGKFGAAAFVEKLKKDRFEVAGVSFGMKPPEDKKEPKKQDIIYLGGETEKKIDLPDDCEFLFIAGPSLPIPQQGLDAIERFMDRNGRMVVCLDAFADRAFSKWKETGLESLLKKYGVIATNEVVLRLPLRNQMQTFREKTGDPSYILALPPEKGKTALAKQFQETPLFMASARVVKPGTSTKYQVETLFETMPQFPSFAEEDPQAFADLSRHIMDLDRRRKLQDVIAREPLSVAVTVTESAGNKPRMVVFGDAEFVSNEEIDAANYDIARSAIEWMGERGFIGPTPKETSTFSFAPLADLRSMVYGAAWTMIILVVILGGAVWLIRRR